MTPLVTPGTFGSHQNTIYLGKHPSNQTRPKPPAPTTGATTTPNTATTGAKTPETSQEPDQTP